MGNCHYPFTETMWNLRYPGLFFVGNLNYPETGFNGELRLPSTQLSAVRLHKYLHDALRVDRTGLFCLLLLGGDTFRDFYLIRFADSSLSRINFTIFPTISKFNSFHLYFQSSAHSFTVLPSLFSIFISASFSIKNSTIIGY